MKKVFSVLLSLVMLMSLLSVGVAVSAATPDTQVIEAAAGETIQIKFVEDNCYGVGGDIEYSNLNLFSSLTPGGSTSYGKITDKKFILSSADKTTCEVILTVKISEDAKVGDTCVVSFTNCELVENNEDFTGRSGYTKSVTVKVVKKETLTTKPTTKPTTEASKLPTRPGYNGTTNGALDYSRLIELINIAQALNQYDWTSESWAELESALDYAFDILYAARTQKEINDAADALQEAIDALVRIDDAALRDLIQEILDWLDENDKEGLFADLYAALVQVKDALESGDQSAIAEAYDVLKAAFDALKPKWSDLFGKNTKTVVSPSADVDGQALHSLIQEILDWLEENDQTGVFADLYAALVQAQDALESGDQNAIAEAYDVLKAAFDALKLKWSDLFDEESKGDHTADATEPTSSSDITAPTSQKEAERVEADIVKKGNDNWYIIVAFVLVVGGVLTAAALVLIRKKK